MPSRCRSTDAWCWQGWKRPLINAFKFEAQHDPDLALEWKKFGDDLELLPALNNEGHGVICEQSRRFSMPPGSAFVEWLYAFGPEHDLRWSTPKAWGDGPTR